MNQPTVATAGSEVVVDASQWPIIIVTYPETLTLDAVKNYSRALHTLFERAVAQGKHVATVVDVSRLRGERMDSAVRDALFAALGKIDKDFPFVAVCDAVYSPSIIVRGIISAHSVFRGKRNHVTRCFSSIQEGLAWAQLTLRAHKSPS